MLHCGMQLEISLVNNLSRSTPAHPLSLRSVALRATSLLASRPPYQSFGWYGAQRSYSPLAPYGSEATRSGLWSAMPLERTAPDCFFVIYEKTFFSSYSLAYSRESFCRGSGRWRGRGERRYLRIFIAECGECVYEKHVGVYGVGNMQRRGKTNAHVHEDL